MFHLFRKDIEKHCAYCKSGSVINEGQVICSRRGVVDSADHCRHFCYDPLKRVPPRPPRCAISILPRIFPCKAGQRPEQ